MIFALALAASTAHAAAPDSTTAVTMDRYAVRDVDLLRWASDTATVGKLAAGDKVEFVLEDHGLDRVRKGATFGWVPADALTTTAPPTPAATPSTPVAAPAQSP